MKRMTTTHWSAVLAFAVCAVLAGHQAQADGKKKRTGTNTFLSEIQKNTSAVGDVPGHVISQQVALQRTTKASDPMFQDMQLIDYGQYDESAGTGTHRGYSVGTLKDGSVSPARYEGSHKTTTKADGSWEWTAEGKYWLLPGTGKTKNAKGEGVYKCKVTAVGGGCDWEEESEY
jgi:hypothetical protein